MKNKIKLKDCIISKLYGYQIKQIFPEHELNIYDYHHGYIWLYDGDVVCYVMIEPDDRSSKEVFIAALEVSKKFRNKGIGTQLFNYAVDTLNATDLHVKSDNHIALSIYSKRFNLIHTEESENNEYLRMHLTK